MRRTTNAIAIVTAVCLLTAAPVWADTFTEPGDVGDMPGTAEPVVGSPSLSLDAIVGAINFPNDADMYLIHIVDPAGFSASTDNLVTQNGVRDTMLFLFDQAGFAIIGADGTDTKVNPSEIPVGSFAGPPGDYLLAVSDYDNDPVNVSGEIFPDLPIVGTFGPTGPGAPLPVADWNADFRTPELGQYRIDLTGAVAIPEPSSTILLVGGAVLIAGHTCRRRQARRARQGDNPDDVAWRTNASQTGRAPCAAGHNTTSNG